MSGSKEPLDPDVRQKLKARGYSIRQRIDFVEGETPGEGAPERAWYLVDGPGLRGYVMPACHLNHFANGREVRRLIEQACPYCGAAVEERVAMAREAGGDAQRVRCCASCDWAVRV
jgi:hypothetical protein